MIKWLWGIIISACILFFSFVFSELKSLRAEMKASREEQVKFNTKFEVFMGVITTQMESLAKDFHIMKTNQALKVEHIVDMERLEKKVNLTNLEVGRVKAHVRKNTKKFSKLEYGK